jgi:hypothetical protein
MAIAFVDTKYFKAFKNLWQADYNIVLSEFNRIRMMIFYICKLCVNQKYLEQTKIGHM